VGARPGGTGQPVLADHGAGPGRPGDAAGIVVGAGRGHSVSSGWSAAGWSGAGWSAAGRIVAGWSVTAPAGLVDAGACLVASRDGHQRTAAARAPGMGLTVRRHRCRILRTGDDGQRPDGAGTRADARSR